MAEPNRKTSIPIKGIPEIVAWLLKNCTMVELEFMADLASSRKNFGALVSILSRLTEKNVYELFYEQGLDTGEKLMVFRAAKRGEVAGLKAFELACRTAVEEINRRKEKK